MINLFLSFLFSGGPTKQPFRAGGTQPKAHILTSPTWHCVRYGVSSLLSVVLLSRSALPPLFCKMLVRPVSVASSSAREVSQTSTVAVPGAAV